MVDEMFELFEKMYGYLKELIEAIKKIISDVTGVFGEAADPADEETTGA